VTQQSKAINIDEILFVDRPAVEEIYLLRREVYSNIKLREALEETLSDLNKKVSRSEDGVMISQLGIGLWILNRLPEAEAVLSRVRTRKGICYFYAKTLLGLGRYQDASDLLEQALGREPESFFIRIALVEARRLSGDWENALKMLERLESDNLDRAEYHYEKGRCLELQGLYEEALDEYEKSSVLDPDSPVALFRLAFVYDLRGKDEMAIECYERLTRLNPVHANVFINLGLLFEDKREYDKAASCYKQVLDMVPDHARAKMYLDDALASQTMYYDEDKAKLIEKRNQVLNTPVTDFELSVRSRNCLAKMNIYTLGDLIQKSEIELLSYKNFGETSLIEIKEILRQKGLSLGMGKSELEPASPKFEKIWGSIGGESHDILHKPLSQFELSVRCRRCIDKMNIHTLGDLSSKSEPELMACDNFGQTSLKELKDLLIAQGMELKKS